MKKAERVKEPSVFSRLRPFMGRKQFLIYAAFVLSAVSAFLGLLPFVFIWLIIRTVLNPDLYAQALISRYAGAAMACLGGSMLVYFGALMCSHIAAFRVEIGMQQYGLKKVMYMPLGYYDSMESGRIRKVISDGARSTHTFLAHQLPDMAGAILAPLLLLAAFFIFDWRMGLASLIPMVIGIFLFANMMSPKGQNFQKLYFRYLDEMSAESVEYVRGIPVVKTFGQTVKAFTRFYDSIIRYRDAVYAYTISFRMKMVLFTAMTRAAVFFLIPLSIFLIGRGENLGTVMADFLLYTLISPMLSTLLMRSAYFNQNANIAKQAIDRFDKMLEHVPMEEGTAEVIPQGADIEFRHVSFSYPGSSKPAVQDVSFKIEEGMTYALVGASGSGKTTVARLAARFWDAAEGEVLIGGMNVKDYPKDQRMNKMAFVFQNSKLLKKTIRENICFGRQNVSEAELKEAIRRASAEDIISSLPQGVDTVYGQKGTWLSGGEQQRIALARAFLKDAPIVLLDEATAFADPENESLIIGALKELGRGKTCLMIAHRLSSVRDADCILVMEEGAVAERGTHEELLAKQGLYAAMYSEYERSVSWTIGQAQGEEA